LEGEDVPRGRNSHQSKKGSREAFSSRPQGTSRKERWGRFGRKYRKKKKARCPPQVKKKKRKGSNCRERRRGRRVTHQEEQEETESVAGKRKKKGSTNYNGAEKTKKYPQSQHRLKRHTAPHQNKSGSMSALSGKGKGAGSSSKKKRRALGTMGETNGSTPSRLKGKGRRVVSHRQKRRGRNCPRHRKGEISEDWKQRPDFS